MSTKNEVLNINNLTFNYNNNTIINDLNLNIYDNEVVGLIGPNGSGKTTLFFLITGINSPHYGNIELFGKEVKSGVFNPQIGMVFQKPDDQLFCPTVYDDISFGPRNMGLSKEEIQRRTTKVIETLNIEKLIDKAPHNISGGEKCLVTTAGILAMDPDFIIFDEPTANLDMKYRRKLIEFIKNTSMKSMFIASHDLEFILEVCTRVLLIDKGTIIADGIPNEIMSDKYLMEKHNLEVPYSLR